MSSDSLGDRLKALESIPRISLQPRMPLIIRLDGKAFSSYTKGFDKPWSILIRDAFIEATKVLFKEVSGLKLTYQQSDELTLLITDYETYETQPWLKKDVQKIVSISSSILTANFNKYMWNHNVTKTGYFDSRAFIVPKEEVCNVFLWRERDCQRNSVSMLAQKNFPHKLLQRKKTTEMKEMLLEKGINWDDCEGWQKNGYCMTRNTIKTVIPSSGSDYGDIDEVVTRHKVEVDWNIPSFSEDRNYIERFVYAPEENKK